MMETKLTVIVDNTPGKGLSGEWGLSMLVEHAGKNILVDAGASELFAENLAGLGFDIRDIDCAVLSHAHFDHGNGMPLFFRKNEKAKFYLRSSSQENCYTGRLFFKHYIGLPRNVLSDYSDRIEYISGDFELCEGAFLIPHKTSGLEKLGKRDRMYTRTPSGFRPDCFDHEQSLVLDTEKGLVIINSCSHGGVVNIINEVRETFPGKHVHAVIGGFHLFNKTDKEVRETAQEIVSTGIDFVCTGHCTKDRAFAILKEALGERLEQLRVGLELSF